MALWKTARDGAAENNKPSARSTTRRPWKSDRKRRFMVGVTTTAFISSTVAASLMIYPHNMAFFNSLAGGPKNGPNHLINSNVDWGQDLMTLKNWTSAKSPEQITYLAFYNFYNPFDFELQNTEPWPFEKNKSAPARIPDGFYAISVNLLYDFPWPVRDRVGNQYRIDLRPLAHLRTVEPIGRAGYSIRIFSADQVRAAYALPERSPLF